MKETLGIPDWQRDKTVEEIKEEVIEKAGDRSLKESGELMEGSLSLLQHQQRSGEKRIHHAETVNDIDTSRGTNTEGEDVEIRRFQEGGVGYAKLNGGEIIMTSDIHGNMEDLTKPLEEFLERVENGEDVYFSCSGDISLEGNKKLGSLEALLAAQQKYPERVFITPGNGDRRGTSLFAGLAPELGQKYLPEETFTEIEAEVERILEKLWKEQQKVVEDELVNKPGDAKLEKHLAKIKKYQTKSGKRMDYNLLFGAVLMSAGRNAGAKPLDAKHFATRQIYSDFKNMLGIEGKSPALENSVGRAMIEATRKIKNPDSRFGNPNAIKQVFEHWQSVDQVINNLPTMQFIETPQGRIMISHTQPAEIGSLGPYVYDPIDQQESLWHKFQPGMEGKKVSKGHHVRYGEGVVGDFAKKNSIALAQFGHTHINRNTVLEADGHQVTRLEIATSHRDKARGAHYARVNLDRLNEVTTSPEQVIETVKV
ncbi:metallophosphoesterase [Patescibacteria group bacterium]|nr:metallophosphoesterase [Patescibacteria group bacterium]